MVKITKKRNHTEIKLTKPWEKISFAGVIAGFLSGAVRVVGVPLDKEGQSMFFLKTVCDVTDGDFKFKCLGILTLLSLVFLISGWMIIFKNAKNMKEWKFDYHSKDRYSKEIIIPGVVKGIVLYLITIGIGFLVAVKLFT